MTVLDRPRSRAATRAPRGRRGGPLLQAIDVVRDYPSGDTVIHALRGVNLAADPGELVAVRGRSGSGKTTFLNILGGLDHPTSGTRRHRRPRGLGDVRGRARRRPAPVGRVHLPVVRARADPVGRRERRDPAPARPGRGSRARRAGPRAARAGRAWAAGRSTDRTSCRAASSSGSRSPGRWPTGRGSCSPTSRPASSTPRPAT